MFIFSILDLKDTHSKKPKWSATFSSVFIRPFKERVHVMSNVRERKVANFDIISIIKVLTHYVHLARQT